MAFPNQELFLNRFVAFNRERYSGDPHVLAILDEMTADTVSFFNLRKETLPSGVVKHLTDLNVPGKLNALDQLYIPASYPDHGVAQLVTPDPQPTETLENVSEAGVYWVVDAEGEPKKGALLVPKGDKTVEAIKALIIEKCLFELEDSQITVDENLTVATLDSPTIIGTLVVVESQVDLNVYLYDGTYLYDGSITY